MNLRSEIEGVRGIGVSDEDATPQELYAIGAVFDHLYRGGSPLNCIRVFRKEVNRVPPTKMFGCGLGCGLEEDETVITKAQSADDDTLQTMDWTYNRSSIDDDADTLWADLYTLDEVGTYDRSFRSRDSTLQSSLDGDRARAERFAESYRGKNKSGKRSFNNSKIPSTQPSTEKIDEGQQQIETDETMERLKMWSEVLVAAARENAPIAVAAAAEAKAATAADLTSLVHMLRNTVAEGIPEETRASTTALQATLARAFNTNLGSFVRSHEGHNDDGDIYSYDGSYDTNITPSRPLNSLAKAMQSMATKEPTRTYAVSERDQAVVRQASTKPRRSNASISSTIRGVESKTTVSSVGYTLDSNDTSAQAYRDTSLAVPSPGTVGSFSPKRNGNLASLSPSTASLSGISRADTEGIGSHRGDAASSVTTPVRGKIPSSIRLLPSVPGSTTASTMLQELFITPSRVSSSNSSTAIPQRRSFFRSRESADATVSDAADKNQIIQNILPKSTSSPRRNLPPIPPARSPTTPSTASTTRRLNLSSDSVGTTLSIDGNSEGNGVDNATVVTPPRPIRAPPSTSSPKSSNGISLKKRFSFRKRRTDNSSKGNDTTNALSPRSSMGVDSSSIFQSATNNTIIESFYENPVIAVADESMEIGENMIGTSMNFDNNDTSSTDGVLLTVNTTDDSYEVQSV